MITGFLLLSTHIQLSTKITRYINRQQTEFEETEPNLDMARMLELSVQEFKTTMAQWLSDKESACNTGDPSSIPGLGRSLREEKGYPLQDCGLENSMDCIVHGGLKELDMTEWLPLSLSFHFHWESKNFSVQNRSVVASAEGWVLI